VQSFDVVRPLRSAKGRGSESAPVKIMMYARIIASQKMVADSGSCHDVLLRSLPQLQSDFLRLADRAMMMMMMMVERGQNPKKNGPRSNGFVPFHYLRYC
jgi:hypothetical protein